MWNFALIAAAVLWAAESPAQTSSGPYEFPSTGTVYARVLIRSSVNPDKYQQRRVATDIRRFGKIDVAEEIVREAYQNEGYFKAEPHAELVLRGPVKSPASVDIVINVNAGEQYRLGQIRWTGIEQFSAQQLSALMPVHPGEIFNRQKIAEGIEAVKNLYDSVGCSTS